MCPMTLRLMNDAGDVLAEFTTSSGMAMTFKFKDWLDRVVELGLRLECTSE
jgi:hypothetical protein